MQDKFIELIKSHKGYELIKSVGDSAWVNYSGHKIFFGTILDKGSKWQYGNHVNSKTYELLKNSTDESEMNLALEHNKLHGGYTISIVYNTDYLHGHTELMRDFKLTDTEIGQLSKADLFQLFYNNIITKNSNHTVVKYLLNIKTTTVKAGIQHLVDHKCCLHRHGCV